MLTVTSQENLQEQPSVHANKTALENQGKSMTLLLNMTLRYKSDLQKMSESLRHYQKESACLFAQNDPMRPLQLEMSKMFGCQLDIYQQTIQGLDKISGLYSTCQLNISRVADTLKAFDSQQDKINHYKDKLDKLKKKHDTSKITRNEQKYFTTLHEFEAAREETNAKLRAALRQNIQVLPEAVRTFVQSYMELSERKVNNSNYITKEVFLYRLYEVQNQLERSYSQQAIPS